MEMHIVGLLVLLAVCWTSEGKTCFDCTIRHPQQEFCSHDFVIKATVKSSEASSPDYEDGFGYRSHEVKVKRWFKKPAGVTDITKAIILNVKSQFVCSPTLVEGTTYLILGTYNATADTFKIPLCSLLTNEWENVAGGIKNKLKNDLYANNCDCGVRICQESNLFGQPADPGVSKEECLDGEPDFCTTDKDTTESFCSIERAICKRDDAGKCKWQTGGAYQKCISQ